MSGNNHRAGCCCSASVWKLGSTGNFIWSWYNGGFILGIDSNGSNCWAGGERTNVWYGTDGSYASVWKLGSTGTVVWDWDSGGIIFGVSTDGTNCWVVGERNNSWEGTDGSMASVWKLDSTGAVVWSWDSGGDARCIVTDGTDSWGGGFHLTDATKVTWKLDSSGSLIWYGSGFAGVSWPVLGVSLDGSDVLFGFTNSPSLSGWGVEGLNSLGVTQWVKGAFGLFPITGGFGVVPSGVNVVYVVAYSSAGMPLLTFVAKAPKDSNPGSIWIWSGNSNRLGASGYAGIATDGTDYWVAAQSGNNWQGTDGSFASVWKLDSNGVVIWDWHSGNHATCIVTDGTDSWIGGFESSTWEV